MVVVLLAVSTRGLAQDAAACVPPAISGDTVFQTISFQLRGDHAAPFAMVRDTKDVWKKGCSNQQLPGMFLMGPNGGNIENPGRAIPAGTEIWQVLQGTWAELGGEAGTCGMMYPVRREIHLYEDVERCSDNFLKVLLHEVGHVLGLDDIDARAGTPGWANAQACVAAGSIMLDYPDIQFDDVFVGDEDCKSAGSEYREDNAEPDCEDQPDHHECLAVEEEEEENDDDGDPSGAPRCAAASSGSCIPDPCSVAPDNPQCAAKCIINPEASGCPVNCDLDPFNQECEIRYCGFPTEMGIVVLPCVGTGNSQGHGSDARAIRQTRISTVQSFAFSLFRPTRVEVADETEQRF